MVCADDDAVAGVGGRQGDDGDGDSDDRTVETMVPMLDAALPEYASCRSSSVLSDRGAVPRGDREDGARRYRLRRRRHRRHDGGDIDADVRYNFTGVCVEQTDGVLQIVLRDIRQMSRPCGDTCHLCHLCDVIAYACYT